MRSAHSPFSTEYYPIDELLSKLRVRILRALNRFDWATADELRIALDIHSDDIHAYDKQLSRLVALGSVCRAGQKPSSTYKVSPAGRAELRTLLGRAVIRDAEAIA